MRKLILTCVVLLLITNCPAQITKGALFLGGDIGISREKAEASNNSGSEVKSVFILPVLGTAIKENLVFGAYFLLSNFNGDMYIDANDVEQRIWGGGIFLRKYKPLGKSGFALFLQARTGVEFEKLITAASTPEETETKTFSVAARLYPGISYAVSKKLQIETGFNNLFGFNYYQRKGTSGTISPVSFSGNGFNLYTSLENLSGLYIGFRLLLNK